MEKERGFQVNPPIINVVLPYTGSASKNKMVVFGKGHAYTSGGYRQFKNDLIYLIRNENLDRFWLEIKTHVGIMFYRNKKHSRADVCNLVDVICDGVKVAIGVDDKWFSVTADWIETDLDSHINVTVYQ